MVRRVYFTSLRRGYNAYDYYVDSKCIRTNNSGPAGPNLGTLWFAIFLELFLILGVLYTLATDSIDLNRLTIAVFGAVAIVFSVEGINTGIYAGIGSLNAVAAGWFILTIVNILWVLYFTAEADSLTLHVFNSMGTGGLSGPNRRRRTRTQSVMNMPSANGGGGYAGSYAGGGISSGDPYEAKMGGGGMGSAGYGSGGPGLRSQNSYPSVRDTAHTANSISAGTGVGSIHNQPAGGAGSIIGGGNEPGSPLMSGVGAGNASMQDSTTTGAAGDPYPYKAKALYACELLLHHFSKSFSDVIFKTLPTLRTQTKSRSPRESFSISWISKGNGGKHEKLMDRLEVRRCCPFPSLHC